MIKKHKKINKQKKISLKKILIFSLLNLIMLLFLKDFFVKMVLFVISIILIFYNSRLFAIDIDPIPLSSGIVFFTCSYLGSLQFAFFTIPVSHAIAGRFNQFTFVDLISLIISLSVMILIKDFFSVTGFLLILILLNDIIRLLISFLILKAEIILILPITTHTIFYLILISIISPLLIIFLNN
ncbi:hypothetical protein HN827_00795 [archaeon]|jgi:hypothetical protein|nr:hypothetical protein [archaeon]MBT7391337.1 hypothetical protein [archaeon]